MKQQFRNNKTFGDAQNLSKRKRSDEIVDVFKYPEKQYVAMRPVGPLVTIGGHWVNVEPEKKGQKTKAFWTPCVAFDPATETRDSTKHCPWCEDESGWIREDLTYWQNMIILPLEEDKPAKIKGMTEKETETGFKEKGSKTWTPIRAVRLTAGTIRDLKKQSQLNRHTSKKTGEKKAYPLSHVKYGATVEMMYDPDEAPAKKYSVARGEKLALDEDQQEYLMQPIEDLIPDETEKSATKEYNDWVKRVLDKFLKGKGKKSKDEDEDGEEDTDSDEDEDEKPSKKSKSGKSAKKRSRDEDDEDDDEDDNEFEEDTKSSKKKKSSKSKKSRDDDDEDEEDEDDDE